MSQCFYNDYECKVQKIRLAAFSRYGIEVIDYFLFRKLFEEPGHCDELDKSKDHWIFKHAGCFTKGCTESCTNPFLWKLIWRRGGENLWNHTMFLLDEDVTDELIESRLRNMEYSMEEFREEFIEEFGKKHLSSSSEAPGPETEFKPKYEFNQYRLGGYQLEKSVN